MPWLVLGIALSGCGSQSGDDGAIGTFTPLGTPPGFRESTASGVSTDGAVVIGTATAASGVRRAFRWTKDEGASALGLLPGGTWSSAMSVSSHGDVIVGEADGGSSPALHGFRWTANNGSVELPALAGASICTASGVSADGTVVAGTCLTINDEAFRWTQASGSVGLGQFGTGSNATSSAAAVSADGRVIGGAGHPVLNGAMTWDARNVPFVIGTLPGMIEGTASAVSKDGSIVVGVAIDASARSHAFRWTKATGIVPLQRAGFLATHASGTSGDATRTVGWGSDGDADTAIMWDEDGVAHPVVDFLSEDARAAAAGWRLSRARAISQDGRHIVGEGVNPQGATEAWRISLPD